MTRLLSGKLSELETTNGILQVNHTLQKKKTPMISSVFAQICWSETSDDFQLIQQLWASYQAHIST